jgi:hypothetical protein
VRPPNGKQIDLLAFGKSVERTAAWRDHGRLPFEVAQVRMPSPESHQTALREALNITTH